MLPVRGVPNHTANSIQGWNPESWELVMRLAWSGALASCYVPLYDFVRCVLHKLSLAIMVPHARTILLAFALEILQGLRGGTGNTADISPAPRYGQVHR